jgi:hypothetical protein
MDISVIGKGDTTRPVGDREKSLEKCAGREEMAYGAKECEGLLDPYARVTLEPCKEKI